jgi:DNA polymerase/3'-5' exonuclease PolX
MLDFMLAKEYSDGMKVPREFKDKEYAPIGWLMSEKLDGYRGRYNPGTKGFVSRQNKPYNAPQWFINAMPNVHLDGELFCGREGFQKMGAVRKKIPVDEDWFSIKFYVYDAPEIEAEFYDRYVELKHIVMDVQKIWNKYKLTLDKKFHNVTCPLVLCKHHEVESIEQMTSFYQEVLDLGGEGIMIKNPWSDYENKRSNHLLKYKPNFDSEAIIVGYKAGTGKYTNKLGAFICQPLISKGNYQVIDPDEVHGFATSGMDDAIRNSYIETHPIGTIITYEYSGFTNTGKPRFARYMRIRDDVTIKDPDEINIEANEKLNTCIMIFKALSKYERINGEGFKSAAYNKAVKALEDMESDSDITSENLLKVKGIGQKIVEKVNEILLTGTCKMYDSIKDYKDPREVFMKIHGVGPAKANQLTKLGITTIEELKNHMNIDELLNNTQMKGLKYYEHILERIPRKEIVEHESYIKDQLNSIDSSAELSVVGSYRRGAADSGDIDVLIRSPVGLHNTNSIYTKFIETLVKTGYLVEELSMGPKKYMGICKYGDNYRRIDIMFTKPDEYPFAILYFTGSKDFNVSMRADLMSKGMTLNEYSLKDNETKKKVNHKFVTEKEIFDYIGLEYVEPENR